MSVSIIAGGQYGSEGKGKVTYYWARRMNAQAAVRVGGSNSGHTVCIDGKDKVFRMLPVSSIDGVISILPAGTYIATDVLMAEARRENISKDKLIIDANAVIITDECKSSERGASLHAMIGSTESGTGEAVLRRVARKGNALLAKDCEALRPYIQDTKAYMRQLLDEGGHIVIEGTQGYGLSNLHAKAYPYCTSRDTTAAGFLSETGLSPLDVEHVVMVLRSFPIRVGGNSGPLAEETNWQTVSQTSGASDAIEEHTTVTGNLRRVARFTNEVVLDAIRANNPDVIVMNHVDYIDWNGKDGAPLTEKQEAFLTQVEHEIGRHIDAAGNGKTSLIERRRHETF